MNKKAFTLIELLVVVLIIGILAAVALPQYQKAVEKARVTEGVLMLRDLMQATDRYILANGYPSNYQDIKDSLDVDIKATENFTPTALCNNSGCWVAVYPRKRNDFDLEADRSASGWTHKTCLITKTTATSLCEQLRLSGFNVVDFSD